MTWRPRQRIKVRGFDVDVYPDELILLDRSGLPIASRRSMAGICNAIRRLRLAEREARA